MEQLQPLLKHKFWIIFGIALLFPVVGWFLATGQAKERIDSRISTISGTNVQSASGKPNDQWIQQLTEINDREVQRLNEAAAFLWQEQKRLMVWPPVLRNLVGKLAYRDPIPESALNWYPQLYVKEFERVRNIVRPYDFETEKGLVHVPPAALHIHPNYAVWEQNPGLLTSEEMWDAQEDLWLLEELLRGIDKTNQLANADSITAAYVRQIDRIELRGGSPPSAAGAAAPGDAASEYGGSMGAEYGADSGYAGDFGDMGGEMDPTGGFGGAAKVSFDPVEEFGSDAVVGATGASPAGASSGSTVGGGAEYLGAGGAAGASGQSTQQKRRYIDNEDLPFRTRGFYMELVIDHTKLPELLGELSSLRWPVEIVRVQQGEFTSTGSTAGAPGGAQRGRTPFGGGGGNPFLRGGQSSGLGAAGGAGYTPPGGAFGGAFNQRPMGPMGRGNNPMGPMGPMGQTRRQPGEKYRTAMQDPVLARVAIAGLMTLFENPQNLDPGTGIGAAPAAPAAPPAVTPDAAVDPATVDPAAVDPAAAPDAAAPSPDAAAPASELPPPGDQAGDAPQGSVPQPGDPSTPAEPPASPPTTGEPQPLAQPAAEGSPAGPTPDAPAGGADPSAPPDSPAEPVSPPGG